MAIDQDHFNREASQLRSEVHALLAATVVTCGGAIAMIFQIIESPHVEALPIFLFGLAMPAFVLCLFLCVFVQYLIVRRDFMHLEAWRNGAPLGEATPPEDKGIWRTARTALACFVIGMALSAFAAACVALGAWDQV